MKQLTFPASKYRVQSKNNSDYQKGAVLLEALIAIVIFSFGMLALMGLQSVMIKDAADSTFRAEAAYVVEQTLAEMQSNPIGIGKFTSSVSALPNGKLAVSPLSGGRLQLVVTWKVGDQPEHNFETVTSMFSVR
jgi:type IV pilus assembly protein PilV